MDCSDIIYGQSYNASFHKNLDQIQYNAALTITGAIREIVEKQILVQKMLFFL